MSKPRFRKVAGDNRSILIRSAETRARISSAQCGKKLSAQHRAKLSVSHSGPRHRCWDQHLPLDTRLKIGDANRGEKSGNWRGGTSFAPYTQHWTRKLRRDIRERDDFICRVCGKRETKRAFAVHHINYFKWDCQWLNLITLCGSCHSHTNSNRESWQAFFERMMALTIIAIPKETSCASQ